MRTRLRIVLSTALLSFLLIGGTGCLPPPDTDETRTPNPGDGDGIGTSPSGPGAHEEPLPLPPQCVVNGPVVGTPGHVILVVCPKK